ncbi:XdhC family protein [Paratractidigestivibacter sp.]|uniref:XdhC family protein n=1 Tax=Paratractidigestivibacter sp. TaxID=2847316 RepID=UPI002ACB1105|nr:XdhC family protein [Paratractidigestivibacter sp.]
MNDFAGTINDPKILAAARAELAAGRPVALASLLSTKGSMPRHEGARMLGLADGSYLGTVGGGNIEFIVQRRCGELLRAASAGGPTPASLEWMTHEKNAMACGGDALLAVRLLGAGDAAWLDDLARAVDSGEAAWLVEDWSDPSAPRVFVLCEGDGCDVPAWDEGRLRYAEPVGAEPVCYVFGGGHVGQALVPVLASVGFVVDVVDDREGVCDPANFPAARNVTCGAFEDLDSYTHITPRDYVVVLTHGHLGDAAVLERVLPHRPAYVGCIGSRRKAAFVRDALVERGIDRAAADAVHLPIGEDILAVTPAEIAVSIAAQIIRCRAELRPQKPHGKV